jgi:hypothetical protein
LSRRKSEALIEGNVLSHGIILKARALAASTRADEHYMIAIGLGRRAP